MQIKLALSSDNETILILRVIKLPESIYVKKAEYVMIMMNSSYTKIRVNVLCYY